MAGKTDCGVRCLFYVLSPIQPIPTLIPVIGQLDDAVVLYLCVSSDFVKWRPKR